MSQLLINDYLKQLDLIKKVGGSSRETILREAFKDLLKAWGKQQGLVFLAEYPLKTATRSNIAVDGALLHELRMPLGYWEAKDASDDLDEEIVRKFKKGYPQGNIIFSDDVTAVLVQHKNEVLRCGMADTARLSQLLKLFFSFERPEIAGFRAAVEQFKTDLPAVLEALRSMIAAQESGNAKFRAAAAKFLTHAQEAINPGLTDSETTLRGIPPEAWDYRLGNRCALEWVLDQYKEKKPKDPTIREKFDTYRFADYREKVIGLLMRVTTVSVETQRITQAMKAAAR